MRTFLIRILQENGKIYLRSLNMDTADGSSIWLSDIPNAFEPTILQHITDRFDYSDKKDVEKAVERIALPKFDYYVKGAELVMFHEAAPISYTLPANVTQALDLLSAYHSYLKNKKRSFASIQFIDFDVTKKFSGKRRLTREELWDLSKTKAPNADYAIRIMVDRILSLPNPPPEYHQLFSVLHKMKKYNDSFGHLLKGLTRAALVLDLERKDLKDFTIRDGESTDAALRRMYALVRQVIGNGMGGEATRFLDALQIHAIQQAYAKFNGDDADSHYIKKTILKEKFTLRPDGKIAVNFMNSRYIKKQMEFGNTYNKEGLRATADAFAKKAGLQFERTPDLEQLVFTKESSQKLIEQHLHINSDYMKKFVRLKNDFHRLYKANKESDGNFKFVAVDVIKLILKYCYPELAAMMNLDLVLSKAFDESKIQPFKTPQPSVPEPESRQSCVIL